MIAMQEYDRSPASIRSAVTRLNAQGGYDGLLIADGAQSAAGAATIVKTGPGEAARILGTELWSTESDLPQLAGLRGAWFASASETMFSQLRTRYRARYGKSPYRLASLGYDSVLLAVKIAANWPIGRPFPEAALRDPGGFAGVDGAFRFRPDGVAERALQVQQVDAGGLTVVSAAPKGF
jgi:hypothetical protein